MEEEGAGNGGRPDLPAAGGADLINALPEDLLVQVIRRLRCARAAARTSILSRPWRGLWRRLANLTFRDIALDSLQDAVNSLVPRSESDGYFLLDIRVPRREGIFSDILDSDEVSSLLHALVRLSPVELRFDARLKSNLTSMVKVNMPQFSRTTSMELHGLDLRFTADSSVLGLWMDSFAEFRCTHTEPSLAKVIEKHLLADFSVLHLHLSTMGHAFGAFVSYLLGIRRIRTSTRRLKIALQRFMMSPKCREYCPCDVPKNWRSQTISLINLEEVELEGFEGEDHEIDLLKLIFQCAPLLKRMTEEITTSNNECKEILDIFKAYPFVECNVDRTHGPARVVSQHEPREQHLQVDERSTVDQKVPM